jgi:hypothetical protein
MLSAHYGDSGLRAVQRLDPPKIIKHVGPVCPDNARRARMQGVVVVEATIGADGTVRDAKILQSIPELDQALTPCGNGSTPQRSHDKPAMAARHLSSHCSVRRRPVRS